MITSRVYSVDTLLVRPVLVPAGTKVLVILDSYGHAAAVNNGSQFYGAIAERDGVKFNLVIAASAAATPQVTSTILHRHVLNPFCFNDRTNVWVAGGGASFYIPACTLENVGTEDVRCWVMYGAQNNVSPACWREVGVTLEAQGDSNGVWARFRIEELSRPARAPRTLQEPLEWTVRYGPSCDIVDVPIAARSNTTIWPTDTDDHRYLWVAEATGYVSTPWNTLMGQLQGFQFTTGEGGTNPFDSGVLDPVSSDAPNGRTWGVIERPVGGTSFQFPGGDDDPDRTVP